MRYLPSKLVWSRGSLLADFHRRSTVSALLIGFLLLGPGAALAEFCVGINCGADLAGWHCHTVNAQGNQCWDAQDDMCEMVPGFGRLDPGSSFCDPATVTVGGLGGTIGTQAAALGGFNQFRSQIAKRAAPRFAEPSTTSEEGDAGGGGGFHFSEIVAAGEYEQWNLFGLEGTTSGLRLSWNRETENGHILGVSGSYQEAEPDFGDSTELIDLNASYGRALGSMWRWGVSANLSDVGGFVDSQLYGAGGHVSFASYRLNGHVFSGGLIARFSTSSDELIDQDLTTVGAGVAYGLPIGQRFSLDLDAYGINVVDPTLDDDLFYLLGAQFGVTFTPRLTLHVGYRILEGIDALDSDTFTLGFASRWD